MNKIVEESRQHPADLIEACQRCAWHLGASVARIDWPLTSQALEQRQMNLALFEPLAAINLCSRWTPSDIATACEKARDIAACIEVGNFQDSGAWRPAVDNPFAALWCVGMRGLRPGVTP